jgi:hypothetical protein
MSNVRALMEKLEEKYPALFSGALRESEESLHSLEYSLGVTLPSEVRFFLRSCGSGLSNAFPSINASIADTLRYRTATSLPHNYVVLGDRNDAGTVLLDTNTTAGAVLWLDSHATSKIAQGLLTATEHDFFPNFLTWVQWCIEDINGDTP